MMIKGSLSFPRTITSTDRFEISILDIVRGEEQDNETRIMISSLKVAFSSDKITQSSSRKFPTTVTDVFYGG